MKEGQNLSVINTLVQRKQFQKLKNFNC